MSSKSIYERVHDLKDFAISCNHYHERSCPRQQPSIQSVSALKFVQSPHYEVFAGMSSLHYAFEWWLR
jgi:hypothetical protein